MSKKSRNGLPLGASGRTPEGWEEGTNLTPPEGGYELYSHKNAESMQTRNWHGLYWARQNEGCDYEICTVPVSSGEYSTRGGVWPREGFKRPSQNSSVENARFGYLAEGTFIPSKNLRRRLVPKITSRYLRASK